MNHFGRIICFISKILLLLLVRMSLARCRCSNIFSENVQTKRHNSSDGLTLATLALHETDLALAYCVCDLHIHDNGIIELVQEDEEMFKDLREQVAKKDVKVLTNEELAKDTTTGIPIKM